MQLVLLERKALLVVQAQLGLLVLLEVQVQQDRKVLLEILDLQVQQVLLALRAQLVLKDQLEHKE